MSEGMHRLLVVRPDPWTAPQPDPDWLRQHGDDLVPVKLVDLLSVVGRLQDAERDPGSGLAVWRLVTCDLPRLREHLPPEALEEL